MNNNDMKLAVANSLNKQILLNEDDDHDEHGHHHEATSYDPHVWRSNTRPTIRKEN